MFTVGGATKQGRGTSLMVLKTIFLRSFIFISVSNYFSEKNGTVSVPLPNH